MSEGSRVKRRKSRRIQTTIALAFAGIVFATASILSVLSYSFTREAVQRTSRDYTGQLIAQVQTNIDSYIAHMENIAEVVQLNEQVQEYFGGTVGAGRRSEQEASISGFLNSVSRTRDDISLILVAGAAGHVLTNDPQLVLNTSVEIPGEPWYVAALNNQGRAVVSSSHVQNIVDGEYRWVITLSRTIDNPTTGAPLGVLLVDLNFSVINDLVNQISLGNRGYLFIVDAKGSIVYHPRQELIYSDLEQEYIDRVLEVSTGSFTIFDEKGERFYTVSTSGRTGWRTVGVNYAAEMVPNRGTIRQFYSLGALIFVIVAVLISVLISHRLSQPIMRLRSSMQAVERGDFDISVDVSGEDEIGQLAKDFNIMIAQIKELMRRNAEEQEQKRKSELLALQNQITPHFLYNTLDSVIWMAEGKQYANVVTTVSALARLLRLSISKGDELVAIRDEIEHISSYLTIQKLRYRDRLDFKIEVDESILQLKTPKVILQPLVENAIYHGIKNKEGGGHVTVRGALDGGHVVLAVADDGVGMSRERVRAVLGEDELKHDRVLPASASPARRGSRVGVRNVHERIQLYFGKTYGLSFVSNNGNGTLVQVRLPVVHAEEERDA